MVVTCEIKHRNYFNSKLFQNNFISHVTTSLELFVNEFVRYTHGTTTNNAIDSYIVRYINPLKCSGIKWLHFEVFNAIQV